MQLIVVFLAWHFISPIWTRLYVAGWAGTALGILASLPKSLGGSAGH